jgi:hypothetical protein
MFRVYGLVLRDTLKFGLRGWRAALALPILGAILWGASALFTGVIGGFVTWLIALACAAAYLYLLADVVQGSKVRLRDLRAGAQRLWDVVSVSFALFIIGLGVEVLAAAARPNGVAVRGIAALAMAFFFNAIPELLYRSSSRSFALLKESVDFVMANPFAWFFPNVLVAVGAIAASGPLWVENPGEIVLGLTAFANPLGAVTTLLAAPPWAIPLLVVGLHLFMVFRGLLYQQLVTGGDRMAAWRAKTR